MFPKRTPMEITYHLYIIKENDILGSSKQEENKNFYIVLQVSLNLLLVVPYELVPEFKKLLISYYEDYDNESIKRFLKDNCWRKIN